MKKIVIVGGGASGLAAAITAARKGCQVTVLEHKERPGKKILATGNGRCNLTNLRLDPDTGYRGGTPGFAASVLSKVTVDETLAFFLRIWACQCGTGTATSIPAPPRRPRWRTP